MYCSVKKIFNLVLFSKYHIPMYSSQKFVRSCRVCSSVYMFVCLFVCLFTLPFISPGYLRFVNVLSGMTADERKVRVVWMVLAIVHSEM